MNYWLLSIPLLSAFIGWLTIKIAIRLLFKPYTPASFLGFKIQGVFPARQKEIAAHAATFAAQQLAGDNTLQQKINDPKNFDQVKPVIEAHMDDFLRNRLKDQMPMISMFIGDKTINSLKEIFIKEIESLFPQVMQRFTQRIQQQFDIATLVRDKINAVSPQDFYVLVYPQLNKQLFPAIFMGATIGFLIGLVQLAIVLLS